MIWFILAGIAAISYIVYYIVRDVKKYGWHCFELEEILALFFGTIIMAALAACILMLSSSMVCSLFAEIEYTVAETKEITALNDNSTASGYFFLGSGQVDEEMKYFFVEETEKGKHVDSVSAKNAYVIESNSETPRIELLRPDFKNKGLWWIAFPMQDPEYRIYIPEDSITTDFNVDLE